jgi:transposase
MLQNLSIDIRECYLLAKQCRRWADIASTSSAKVDFLDMERRWLSLAHNYEFSELLLSPSGKRERQIITSVQRRRRWTAAEKVRMVEETFEPGVTVSLVARRHGVAPNQLFTWRRLVVEGALTAAGSGEQVVPASDYRALRSQVRELQRLLGKKTLEAEILPLLGASPVNQFTSAAG